MSNAKHTPGPWRTVEIGNLLIIDCEVPGGRTGIAKLPVENTNMANARLISCAPEMLDTLSTFRNLAGFEELLESKYSKALVFDLIKTLDEIIAKARGETK